MPQQFVFEPQYQNQTDDLMLNLAENVRYRRAQQARKSAKADELKLQMATGQLPYADLAVTDEGIEGAGGRNEREENLRGFYGQLRQWAGQDDLTLNEDGSFQADVLNDPEAIVSRLSEKAAAERLRNQQESVDHINRDIIPAQQGMLGHDTYTGEGNIPDPDGKAQGGGSVPPPPPLILRPPTPDASTPTPETTTPDGKPQVISPTSPDFVNHIADVATKTHRQMQQQQQEDAAQNGGSGTQPPNTRVRVGAREENNTRYKETGKLGYTLNEEASTIKATPMIKTTTKAGMKLTDEVQTRSRRLLGLAALSDMNASQESVAGYNQRTGLNTFGVAYERRQKDLDTYDAQRRANVAQSKIEGGEIEYKAGRIDSGADVMRSGEMAARTTINANTNVANNSGSDPSRAPQKMNFEGDDGNIIPVDVGPDGGFVTDTPNIPLKNIPRAILNDGTKYLGYLQDLASLHPGGGITFSNPRRIGNTNQRDILENGVVVGKSIYQMGGEGSEPKAYLSFHKGSKSRLASTLTANTAQRDGQSRNMDTKSANRQKHSNALVFQRLGFEYDEAHSLRDNMQKHQIEQARFDRELDKLRQEGEIE